jgi:hypothetical protein
MRALDFRELQPWEHDRRRVWTTDRARDAQDWQHATRLLSCRVKPSVAAAAAAAAAVVELQPRIPYPAGSRRRMPRRQRRTRHERAVAKAAHTGGASEASLRGPHTLSRLNASERLVLGSGCVRLLLILMPMRTLVAVAAVPALWAAAQPCSPLVAQLGHARVGAVLSS